MLHILLRIFKWCAVSALLLIAAGVWWSGQPLRMDRPTVDFEILRGDSMKQISRTVEAAGLELWPPMLTWLARLSGHANRIKAGSYRIDGAITPWELVQLMSTGANAYADMTIVEGWSFARLRAALNAHPEMAHDSLAMSDAEIMTRIGLAGVSPEGWFAPETYSFSRGGSDLDVLQRARERMDKVLREEWNARAPGLPLKTPYEALILASVVEKETGRAADRELVASVFINRLRMGMPLQSDPTVIYGLGEAFDGNLRKRDLQADTPYNSYTRGGLPPTPIAMPGLAALRATLHPSQGNYLYFVARGDGSSEFSRTLDEHNRAVARYQKAGRKP